MYDFSNCKPYKLMEPALLFEGLVAACFVLIPVCAEVSRRRLRRTPFAIPLAGTCLTIVATVLLCAGVFACAAAIGVDGWRGRDLGWIGAIEELVTVALAVGLLMVPVAAVVGFIGRWLERGL
jgi:hypothetical protein